jgi:CxxC motif-containing protein
MQKQLICINCPMGCRLEITLENDQVTQVAGNICPKGVSYAGQEAVRPMRVLTSLMFAANRDKPFSVKTAAPVPKSLLFDCVDAIFAVHPTPPLACGDIVISDVCGTGVDVISTQDVE